MAIKELKGIGPGVMFYPATTRLTDGDTAAALLLCQLAWWSSRAEDGWFAKTADVIEQRTGLTRRQQERARRVLTSRKLIQTSRSGMPARLHFRVDHERVADAWAASFPPTGNPVSTDAVQQDSPDGATMSPPNVEPLRLSIEPEKKETAPGPREQGSMFPAEAMFGQLSADRLLAGDYDDGRVPEKRLMDLALKLWARTWGKDPARVVLTKPRERAWKAMAKEGRAPSEVAKAIVGMTHDPWPERDLHCDWPHVQRNLERWVDYAEKQGTTPALRISMLPFETKTINGTVVPHDYDWQEGDSFCQQQGERFDPRRRGWVKRSDPAFHSLAPLNAGVARGR